MLITRLQPLLLSISNFPPPPPPHIFLIYYFFHKGIDLLSSSSVYVVVDTAPSFITNFFCIPLMNFIIDGTYNPPKTVCECYSTCPSESALFLEQENFRQNMRNAAKLFGCKIYMCVFIIHTTSPNYIFFTFLYYFMFL